MQDVNVFNNLRQLSLGQVKVLEYSHYDIDGCRFQTAKLEASRPLAATTNSGFVTSGEDATSHVTNYYDILQNIIEYMLGGAKELKVVFFECDWFDPINNTKVDEFGMVEVKHGSRYSGSNLLLAHQAQYMYCLSYPQTSLKNWWVIYYDILTQGLIRLIEYSYHQGTPSFPEAHLQRTLGLSVLDPEQFQDE
jgi:hypothetical protein